MMDAITEWVKQDPHTRFYVVVSLATLAGALAFVVPLLWLWKQSSREQP